MSCVFMAWATMVGGPTKAHIEYIRDHLHAFPGIELRFSTPDLFSARQTFFTPPYAHPGMCYLWWLRTSSSSIPFQGVTV